MSKRMAKHWLVAAALSLCHSGLGLAGGWSGGGGGELLEHAQNPWFLELPGASRPVRYCVVASDDFPVAQAQLETVVTNVMRWWDNQFSNAYYPDNKIKQQGHDIRLQVRLITSRFIKEDCRDETDLAFQFGYLTAEQKEEFARLNIDLTRYVATTIRTDYNQALRGKGFIYISPDRGPRAFRGEKILSEAWTKDGMQSYRLQSVVAHELGHVFGLPHSSAVDSIMGAKLAEMMVSETDSNQRKLAGIYSTVFFPKTGMIGDYAYFCGLNQTTQNFRRFFAIPDTETCFRVRWSLNALVVETAANEDQKVWRELGRAAFADGGQRRYQQLVTLWLPENQTAFPGLAKHVSSLLGPATVEVQHSATFRSVDGQVTRAIFVQASARYIQIGGMGPNGIIPDLLPETTDGRAVSGWSSR